MAVSCRVQSSKIKIVRQGGSDNFYVSWALTSAQKKRKITRKVYTYKTVNKKKKYDTYSTTKKFPDVIASYTVKWYYRTVKGGKWYLDKTITDIGTGYSTTSHDLWSPPPEARQLKVTVRPISKKYKKNKSGATANWFSVDSTAKTDSDYDEYPQAPSIGEFTIKNKTLEAQVIYNLTNFDREETTAVRLQVLRNGSTLMKFKKKTVDSEEHWYVDDGGSYDIERKFTESNPIDSSGIVDFVRIELKDVGSYQVRGAIASYDGKWLWSEYSSWSSSIDTRPDTPEDISVQAVAATQVKVTWSSVKNITRYEIEYASDDKSFDSGTYQTVTVEDATTHVISGLEAGHKWYFRVKSVNDADKSDPSKIVSTLLATKPSPPTTWSSVNVASITDTDREDVLLYWIHNSVDGSAQRMARFRFEIGGVKYYHKVENTKTDDYGELVDETSYVNIWDLDLHSGGEITEENRVGTFAEVLGDRTAFKWMVATRGISTDYSDYSVERTIDIYKKPTLSLSVSDGLGELSANTFTMFPLKLSGNVKPPTQKPISYHISITAGEAYTAIDEFGEEVQVVSGNEIYSHYIDVPDNERDLSHEIKAGDIYIEEGKKYKIIVTAYTDAGLNCTAEYAFDTDWDVDESEAQIDAIIEYNDTYRFATIRPYYTKYIGEEVGEELGDYEPKCYTGTSTPSMSATTGDMYFDRTNGNVYSYTGSGWSLKSTFVFEDVGTWYSGITVGGDIESDIYSDSGISSATVNDHYFNTDTGDIFRCTKSGDAETAIWEYVWNCFWEMTNNITDIELDIYRKEIGGSFVLIQEDISNALQSSSDAIIITDLHPSFGTCTYRIVARNIATGQTFFEDIEETIPESSVVIQWDEEWKDKKESESDEEEGMVYEGAVLVLPANIKLSDSNNVDVNFAEYIGRSRPVAYYGTQKGEKPSINCEFEKSDTEKLALLRQLMNYSGNVYIREPSGLGYWANVVVSYNKNYKELTIPVTLSITPVEGGI